MAKLLVFVSSKCPHCPKAEGIAKEVAKKYAEQGLSFEKVRVRTGEGKQAAKELGVRSLPATVLMQDGREKKRFVGVPDQPALEKNVEEALGLRKSLFSKIFGEKT